MGLVVSYGECAIVIDLEVNFEDLGWPLTDPAEVFDPLIDASVQVTIEQRELLPECYPQLALLALYLHVADPCLASSLHLESEVGQMIGVISVW